MEKRDVRNLLNFVPAGLPRDYLKKSAVLACDLDKPQKSPATGIPVDWAHLSTVGSVIPGSRFICFKTPFDHAVDYPQDVVVFTTKDLLKEIKQKQLALGMIVDLTDSDRYYNPADLQFSGLTHLKIRVPGWAVPPESSYELFRNQVDKFLSDPKHIGQLVGVHCTHGINRTGWFVSRYLMEKSGVPAKTAIQLFNLARGHDMQRPYLLHDLMSRCHARTAIASQGPLRKELFSSPGNLRGDFAEVDDV